MAATVTTIRTSASSAASNASMEALVADFLTDLTNANRSPNTIRAYASDLAAFTHHHPGPITTVTPAVLRGFFATGPTRVPAQRCSRPRLPPTL